MYKYITCPQCGKRICRAQLGSRIEVKCENCGTEFEGAVDGDGGVHALPLDRQKELNKAAYQV